jgi:hypothetical protein
LFSTSSKFETTLKSESQYLRYACHFFANLDLLNTYLLDLNHTLLLQKENVNSIFFSIVIGFDFSFCTQNFFFYAISSLYGSTRLNRSDRSAETDKPNPSKPKPSLGRCGQYIFTHSLGRVVFLGPHRPNPDRCPPLPTPMKRDSPHSS